MPEYAQIIFVILLFVAVYILTRIFVASRIRSMAALVIQDLEKRGATDFDSAVELPYAKPEYFKFGLRDYRPKAVQALVQAGIVGKTEMDKYYLQEIAALHPQGRGLA